MTNETGIQEYPVKANEVEDYKRFLCQAVNGMLSAIPFGVSIDPLQLAGVASNVAIAMLDTVKQNSGEMLHSEERSNFPQVGERLLNRDDVTSALKAVISQIGKATAARILTSFDVATVNGLRDDELYPCFQACMQALNDPANT
jgi:hypothetical protein